MKIKVKETSVFKTGGFSYKTTIPKDLCTRYNITEKTKLNWFDTGTALIIEVEKETKEK